jgi:hypothetical protein
VSNKDSGLVEHLQEPAMCLCKDFYVILESKEGRVNQTDLDVLEYRKYLKQRDELEAFHPL